MIDCQCHRSGDENPCERTARIIDALNRPVCRVCHQGCAELRLHPLTGLNFQSRLVSPHAPLAMEYVP